MTLIIKNLSYTYPNHKKPTISEVHVTVKKGEFISLIGKSGSGKSTLLKLITGILYQDAGDIKLNDRSITLGDVGYMPQQDLLLPWRTVLENIMLPVEIQKNSHLTREEVRKWLERAGLAGYEQAYPNQLSGGMRQRVSFLRAMITGKDLLLLDEPFGALDSFTKKEMQTWLLSIWRDSKKTIFFITHDLEEACYLSDRILLLKPDHPMEEIVVGLPRPRPSDIVYTSKLVELRHKLEKKMTDEKP
ncbi:ABC transporter ATP-binding protein [Robertmurraya andreesenii]|uniref:Hydroxymethylpyrimidine transport system ATP-binding protein n=1 Tax=Anoxybacillus andreesenii TaxID=1325932 RepID=A0ABT9V953_9BACL|nr:ABC transporter ATP-binding protein [Robertmurraya andreesenii]MDQ0157481.1 putative hydroxymethylpyrimidine transport system ATP-binding protein [Robertmurraya andreesenii]